MDKSILLISFPIYLLWNREFALRLLQGPLGDPGRNGRDGENVSTALNSHGVVKVFLGLGLG